jgi:hypothetical protein
MTCWNGPRERDDNVRFMSTTCRSEYSTECLSVARGAVTIDFFTACPETKPGRTYVLVRGERRHYINAMSIKVHLFIGR